ncbi:MAG: transposase [Devosia sp.]|nr:transposase [Devosia sp.]
MNRAAFNIYVETQLAPTPPPGDIVIDNLSVLPKRGGGRRIRRGAWMLFLLYSPDLNPIEMAFSKLKAHLHRTAARTFDAMFNVCKTVSATYSSIE